MPTPPMFMPISSSLCDLFDYVFMRQDYFINYSKNQDSMKRKSTRTSSAVDIYKDALERKGLLKAIGNKRFDEFLEDVYTTLRSDNEKKKFKSLSDSNLVIGKLENYFNNDMHEESELKYKMEESIYKVEENFNNVGHKVEQNFNNVGHKVGNLNSSSHKVENVHNSLEKNLNNVVNKGQELQYRPEENFYNNGYIQSEAHRDAPPCTNRTECSRVVYDRGYIKEAASLPNKNSLFMQVPARPRSCTPPAREKMHKRPNSCDPKFKSYFPLRPKIERREVDLRIQAALGLLKLKNFINKRNN